jgi:DNA-binding XRE family transcriptional regulator
MKTIRRTHPKMTPRRIGQLSKLATKIDRDEGEQIKAKGRAFFAHYEVMQRVIATLRAARQEQGLSLAEVGEKSGIGKANLSRLENDVSPNPTWDTIMRYAASVGRKLQVRVHSS